MSGFVKAVIGATDATQWSSYTGTPNKIIYVASSSSGAFPRGNDSNSGLTVSLPVATLATAMTKAGIDTGGANVEAWILLRQGDVWNEIFGATPFRSGVSSTQPIIFSCYDPSLPGVFNPGTGPRPVIQSTAAQGAISFAGTWSDNIAIIGLEFYSYQRDPDNPSYIPGTTGGTGIVAAGTVTWWWLEDVKVHFYGNNLDFSQSQIDNVTIYRSIVANAYQANNFASGMHAIWTGSSLYETIFDNNGFNLSESGSLDTGFLVRSHNIYLQAANLVWAGGVGGSNTTGPTNINGCFFSNDASGADIRTGGQIVNNTFTNNPFPFGNYATTADANLIDSNVILAAVDYPGSALASFSGVDIAPIYQGIDGTLGTFTITNNIVANSIATSGFGLTLEAGVNGTDVNNNIFYNWPTASGQMIVSTAGSARTFGSLVGGSGYTPGALFTGSISNATKVMTVTSIASGTLFKGQVVCGDVAHGIALGLPNGAVITGQISGTAGSTGTYSTDYIGFGNDVASTFLSTATWYLVPLTTSSGGGSGAVADIVVDPSGVVTSCVISHGTVFETSIANNGIGYTAGISVLSATPSSPFYNSLSDFGGFSNSTGSGFHVTVASIATNTVGTNVIDATGANTGGAPEPFPFPTRSVGSYAGTIGLTATLAGFLGAAKGATGAAGTGQMRSNWDNRLTATAVNNYIRAGFSLGSLYLTSTPSSLKQVGQSYSQTNIAINGTAPYTYSVSSGSLPVSTLLNTSTGTVSGTPTVSGAFSYTIEVTDNSSPPLTATQTLSGTISSAGASLSMTSSPSSLMQVGQSYLQTNVASGGTASYTYSVLSGSLPAGTSINTSTGTVSGTPIVDGAFSYVIKVTDSAIPTPGTVTHTLSGTISASIGTLTLNSTPSSLKRVGQSYLQTNVASGGTPPYTYSVSSGALPAGTSINTSTGTVSGTPSIASAFDYTIEVIDSA